MKPWLWLGIGLALGAGPAWAQTDAEHERALKIIGGSCFLCHGQDGESASGVFPRLAGQNADYIAKQLENFKNGTRQSTAMSNVVDKLTPDDMQALGTFYASRPAYKQDSSNPLLAGAGRYIYEAGNPYSGVPACSACHGVTGEGATALPRLAGQFASYLESQLKQFNRRERTSDNEVMHVVAEKMTELEMAAVAEYLSGQ